MKAPVERIMIFMLTGLAQWEYAHGRLRTVVGDILNDRKTRSAIGTIDKRVIIAAIGRIEEFMQTIIAGGDIR
jgi:hypothetical protein